MYALYASELAVVVILSMVFAVELGVSAWLLTKGTGAYFLELSREYSAYQRYLNIAVVHDRRIHGMCPPANLIASMLI